MMATIRLWEPRMRGTPASELQKIVLVRHALRSVDHLAPPDADEPVTALIDAGDNGWFLNGSNPRLRLADAMLEAWRISEAPCAYMAKNYWVQAFEAARDEITKLGYGVSGSRAKLTVYRGSREEFRDGLSWTTDFRTAVWFALRGRNQGGIGEVFQAEVSRDDVLVDLRVKHPFEYEVVVDPSRLSSIQCLDLTLEQKEKKAREWRVRAQRRATEYASQGFDVSPPTLSYPPIPEGGWPPFPQTVDPQYPGYFKASLTPDSIVWPSEEHVAFVMIDGEVQVANCPFWVLAEDGRN